MATATAPRIVTYDEAQELLRISRSSLQRLIRADELRIVYIGGSRRILLSSIDAFLRRQVDGQSRR